MWCSQLSAVGIADGGRRSVGDGEGGRRGAGSGKDGAVWGARAGDERSAIANSFAEGLLAASCFWLGDCGLWVLGRGVLKETAWRRWWLMWMRAWGEQVGTR